MNGKIWIGRDPDKVDIRMQSSISQSIHCEVYDKNGKFCYRLTAIYAHNMIEQRKILWHHIEDLSKTVTGAWCLVGDFNNVNKAQDRLEGRMVKESEYEDLHKMLNYTGLDEMASVGDYFTWNNNKEMDPICSRIDRVLANVKWFQVPSEYILKVLPPNVTDHALLHICEIKTSYKKGGFKFNNCIVDTDGYNEVVLNSWKIKMQGSPMNILWHKLTRLKKALKILNKPLIGVKQKMIQARHNLKVA